MAQGLFAKILHLAFSSHFYIVPIPIQQVAFKSYDAEQCKARWIFVSGHLRHYRVLSEVLDDAAIWVNHPWANFNKGSKVSVVLL